MTAFSTIDIENSFILLCDVIQSDTVYANTFIRVFGDNGQYKDFDLEGADYVTQGTIEAGPCEYCCSPNGIPLSLVTADIDFQTLLDGNVVFGTTIDDRSCNQIVSSMSASSADGNGWYWDNNGGISTLRFSQPVDVDIVFDNWGGASQVTFIGGGYLPTVLVTNGTGSNIANQAALDAIVTADANYVWQDDGLIGSPTVFGWRGVTEIQFDPLAVGGNIGYIGIDNIDFINGLNDWYKECCTDPNVHTTEVSPIYTYLLAGGTHTTGADRMEVSVTNVGSVGDATLNGVVIPTGVTINMPLVSAGNFLITLNPQYFVANSDNLAILEIPRP